ncbi:MAG: type III-B CRISPR module RAMP protein Cmr1 [Synergistales bacterium]|nr:type III-B CRISPR module RAMP protein Cmr1 [Synergistales bacterium]
MARTIGGPPPEKPSPGRQEEFFEESFEIHVVTPLFGGGVTAGVVDATNPIRGTSIRGQLRFWWRATVGRSCTSSKELYERESALWGDTQKASPVTISVSHKEKPAITYRKKAENYHLNNEPKDLFKNFGPEQYALFSAKQNDQDIAKEGIAFTLNIRFPKIIEHKGEKGKIAFTISAEKEVLQALRAWVCFGGLGSRTRRGLGALYCPKIHNAFTMHDLSHMQSCGVFKIIALSSPQASSLTAWKVAVSIYQDFRQGFRGEIHEKTLQSGKTIKVPGRSKWPEPDSIRQLTGCSLITSDRDHETPVVPAATLPSFPRAHLGLPILFQFIDGDPKQARKRKDPSVTTVTPLKKERMASPVITRPLFVDGQWHGVLLLLPPEKLEKVHLSGRMIRENRDTPLDVTIDCSLTDEKAMACEPMRGQNIFEALFAFAKEQGFREVTS